MSHPLPLGRVKAPCGGAHGACGGVWPDKEKPPYVKTRKAVSAQNIGLSYSSILSYSCPCFAWRCCLKKHVVSMLQFFAPLCACSKSACVQAIRWSFFLHSLLQALVLGRKSEKFSLYSMISVYAMLDKITHFCCSHLGCGITNPADSLFEQGLSYGCRFLLSCQHKAGYPG